MTFTELNEQYKRERKQYPDALRLRVHRALSWLNQAAAVPKDDVDTRFIFLWIAFNAAYAKDFGRYEKSTERSSFSQYVHHVCGRDHERVIYNIVWHAFSGSIRILLDNRYTFQPFWDYHNGLISEAAWQADFADNQKKALKALRSQNTAGVLLAVFDHLYTLRNQLVHGGATYGGAVNRTQLVDACQILLSIIPAMVGIMMNHPADTMWGKPYYPVIQEA